MESPKQFLSLLRDIGFTGLCDIALVSLVIYAFILALKRTRRAGLALTGIVTITAVYFVALKLNLLLTIALLKGFFAVFLVALVVIFQEDLRHFFERVGLWWIERQRPLRRRRVHRLRRREVETLARTLSDLARARVGALVVVRGRDVIARHIEGGVEVLGRMSEPLLQSIFDPHSLGHDGALIVEGNTIDRLGAHLPLSKELHKLPGRGTRHAAALGMSELSDALCLVVSEEHGDISVARNGEIQSLKDTAELVDLLEAFYDEIAPRREGAVWTDFIRRNLREKALAFGLSLTLWMFFVHQSQTVDQAFPVPVSYSLLPGNLEVVRVEPDNVRVQFRGARRDFEFLKPADIRLDLQLLEARAGRQLQTISDRNLTYPPSLRPIYIEPQQVVFQIIPRTNRAEELP